MKHGVLSTPRKFTFTYLFILYNGHIDKQVERDSKSIHLVIKQGFACTNITFVQNCALS